MALVDRTAAAAEADARGAAGSARPVAVVSEDVSLVRSTWRASLSPRRLVPIVVVCVPLLMAQATYSSDPLAVPVAVLMCAFFVALAPVTYRVLFPGGLDLSHGAVRLVLYASVSAGIVLSVGVALPRVLGMEQHFLGDRAPLAVCIAMFLVGGWGLGRDIGHEQQLLELTREAEAARLLALRAHLDPHFLFNTLNAIAEWCRQDGAVAEAAVLQLSAMLRTLLQGVRTPRWALGQELELVRTLFELHRLRDPERFSYLERAPAPLPELKVPPLALLTLAENAVKHGPGAGHAGQVTLEVSVADDGVQLALENPGAYRGPREGSDGLPTLERHLLLEYRGRARLWVGAATDAGRTRAELWIPKES